MQKQPTDKPFKKPSMLVANIYLRGLIVLILLAGLFFVLAAIFMVLWNGPVQASFTSGVATIGYVTAMGSTLFALFFVTAFRSLDIPFVSTFLMKGTLMP